MTNRFYCMAIFLTVLAVYGATCWPDNAFDEQTRTARAWLHGTMDIDAPDSFIEHSAYAGHKYALHPPMSAAVMVPFVAAFGDSTNQVWVSVVIGAIDVMLMWVLLNEIQVTQGSQSAGDKEPCGAPTVGKGGSESGDALQRHTRQPVGGPDSSNGRTAGLGPANRGSSPRSGAIYLTAFFGFGTTLWYEAAKGDTWTLPSVVGMMFTLLCLNEIFGRKRGWLVGLWAGLAALGQYQFAFCVPVYLLMLWQRSPASHSPQSSISG